VDQYWTTFSRTNSVKVSRNLHHHPKPRGGLLWCFNKTTTTTTLSKLWFGGHQSRSPTTNFSNKISVQLLCLIAWRRESKICVSLVFFYIQSKNYYKNHLVSLTARTPKRFVVSLAVSKNNSNIYYLFLATERPELDNYYTIVCDPYFFSFLGFFLIYYYYHIFGFFLNLSQLSIDRTIWFPKKENFCNTIYWVLNSQFCSLPHQALKWYS